MIIQEPVQVSIVRAAELPNDGCRCAESASVHFYDFNFSSLKVAIWTNLNFYAYEDAIFLAERLCSESKCHGSAVIGQPLTIFLLPPQSRQTRVCSCWRRATTDRIGSTKPIGFLPAKARRLINPNSY